MALTAHPVGWRVGGRSDPIDECRGTGRCAALADGAVPAVRGPKRNAAGQRRLPAEPGARMLMRTAVAGQAARRWRRRHAPQRRSSARRNSADRTPLARPATGPSVFVSACRPRNLSPKSGGLGACCGRPVALLAAPPTPGEAPNPPPPGPGPDNRRRCSGAAGWRPPPPPFSIWRALSVLAKAFMVSRLTFRSTDLQLISVP